MKGDESFVFNAQYILFAMYYWSEDYLNDTATIMSKSCIKNGKKPPANDFKRVWQPYLRVIIFVQKMMEFGSKEEFYEEWVSFSLHKKMILSRIADLCIDDNTITRVRFPDIPTPKQDKIGYIITTYIHDVYVNMTTGGGMDIFATSIGYYQYAKQCVLSELFDDTNDGVVDNKKGIKKGNKKKKSGQTTKKAPPTTVVETPKKAPVSSAAEHFNVDDTTGFSMVEANVVRLRYLLKTQDYDVIKGRLPHIFQPICGVGCTAQFRDGQSGKYVGIFFEGVEVAHISYYHHSQHLYHFKIDVPAHFGLHDLPSPLNYTVPFNFHILAITGEITFAIRSIDNPRTEVHCPESIVENVRKCLILHVAALNSVVRVGRGLHKSRRLFRRRLYSKKRRGTHRRRFHK